MMRNMKKAPGGSTLAQDALLPRSQPVESSYTTDAIASLRYMIEEEKLAGDLYDAFYAQTGLSIFARIGAAEDRHLSALVKQANRAGLDVSDLLALPAGDYQAPELASLFDQLLDAGSVSSAAALAVGRQIELADIADLNEAIADSANTALVGVYDRLLTGSENHLAAFDYYLG